MTKLSCTSASPAQTQAFGVKVAQTFGAGKVYALEGDLGAGKTCFVQGLCAGLDINASVSSPTFAISNEYRDRQSGRRVVHLDLYRLSGPEELDSIGWDDYLESGDTIAVEWPVRVGRFLPEDSVLVSFAIGPEEDSRSIVAEG